MKTALAYLSLSAGDIAGEAMLPPPPPPPPAPPRALYKRNHVDDTEKEPQLQSLSLYYCSLS